LLPALDGQKIQETWRLVQGDKELLALPRAQFIRDIMLKPLVPASRPVQRSIANTQMCLCRRVGATSADDHHFSCKSAQPA